MLPGQSNTYTFNSQPKSNATFANSFLNYDDRDFNSAALSYKHNRTFSKNHSLDDSAEINKRMSQIRKDLGLQAPEGRSKETSYSEDIMLEKYLGRKDIQSGLQSAIRDHTKNQESKDLSNYLNIADDSPFGTTLKDSPKKLMNYTQQSATLTSQFPSQLPSPYKIHSEDASPIKDKSFERELAKYGLNSASSFKVFKNPPKDNRAELLSLQKENELLKNKLDQEKKFRETEIEILNARLDEYKKTLNFDRESESLLKQNVAFYKSQIQELEGQNFELKAKAAQDKSNENAKNADMVSLEEFRLMEQKYQHQIETFKKEVQASMAHEEHLSREGFGVNYVKKLELNIKFLDSQLRGLIEEKSNLQIENENLKNAFKSIGDKLYKEIEEKYKKEIDDKDFIISTLKRDFEVYMQMDRSSEQKATVRKSGKKGISKMLTEPDSRRKSDLKGTKEFDRSSIAPYERIGELENENFLLKEKVELLELQTKNQGSRNSKEQSVVNHSSYENEINQRRIHTLKDSVLFWKEKSEKIANTFFHAIKQIKEDHDRLKEGTEDKIEALEEETWTCIKRIKGHYKKEHVKILDVVSTLQERHNENQAKLADVRSKYKSLATTTDHPVRSTTNKSKQKRVKTRNSEFGRFSP